MSDLRLYLVPNGRDSALFCPECMAQAPRGGDYVVRADVGLRHVYICSNVSRGWLMGYPLCGHVARWNLVAHIRRVRATADDRGREALDGFLGLLALARG